MFVQCQQVCLFLVWAVQSMTHLAAAAAAAAAAAKSLLCATPETAARQAPPSLGFSRQEHWSRLPCPSPVNESEKLKLSCSVVSNSSRPHGLQPTRLLRPWDFPGKSTGVGCRCLLCLTLMGPFRTDWKPVKEEPS